MFVKTDLYKLGKNVGQSDLYKLGKNVRQTDLYKLGNNFRQPDLYKRGKTFRQTDLYELGGGLTWEFGDGWSLNPEILYIEDNSNILTVNYSSTEIWLTLRYDF